MRKYFWPTLFATLIYFNVTKAVDVYNMKGTLRALEGTEKQLDAQLKLATERYRESVRDKLHKPARKSYYKYTRPEIKIRPKYRPGEEPNHG